MSRHDAAVLTLRAFALYAWFQAFEFFAGGIWTFAFTAISYRAPGVTFAKVIEALFPALIYLLAGLFLFLRSRELASWLLPLPSGERDDQKPPHPLGVASVAFAVIGVAFSLHALTMLIRYGVIYAQTEETNPMRHPLSVDLPYILGGAAQLVLGFLLFVKARTFATAWW